MLQARPALGAGPGSADSGGWSWLRVSGGRRGSNGSGGGPARRKAGSRPEGSAMATTVTTQRGPVSAAGSGSASGASGGRLRSAVAAAPRWAGLDPSALRLLGRPSPRPDPRLRPPPASGPRWEGDSPLVSLPPLAARGRGGRGEERFLLLRTAVIRGGEAGSSPGSPPCEEALGKGRGKSFLSACRAWRGRSARALSKGLPKEGTAETTKAKTLPLGSGGELSVRAVRLAG